MTSVSIVLDKENFEDTKQKALERSIEDSGEEDAGYKYGDISLSGEEYNTEEGIISLNGNMMDGNSGKDLGYLSIEFTPDLDTIIELIQIYMKKLGKLKTVLEATK